LEAGRSKLARSKLRRWEDEKVGRWESEMKGLSAGGLGANWHRAERIGSRLKANKS
jgi:hypothetical protein